MAVTALGGVLLMLVFGKGSFLKVGEELVALPKKLRTGRDDVRPTAAVQFALEGAREDLYVLQKPCAFCLGHLPLQCADLSRCKQIERSINSPSVMVREGEPATRGD